MKLYTIKWPWPVLDIILVFAGKERGNHTLTSVSGAEIRIAVCRMCKRCALVCSERRRWCPFIVAKRMSLHNYKITHRLVYISVNIRMKNVSSRHISCTS
jgi:hypothetical protein